MSDSIKLCVLFIQHWIYGSTISIFLKQHLCCNKAGVTESASLFSFSYHVESYRRNLCQMQNYRLHCFNCFLSLDCYANRSIMKQMVGWHIKSQIYGQKHHQIVAKLCGLCGQWVGLGFVLTCGNIIHSPWIRWDI